MSFRAKNFLIVFLLFLAVFQTNRLWFEDISGYDLFYTSVFSSSNQAELGSAFCAPWRVIVNYSGNRFSIEYGVSDYKNADSVIEAALKDGEYRGYTEINYNKLLEGRSVIFEYPFSMPADIYAAAKGQRAALSRLKSFGLVIAALDEEQPSGLKIFFLDSSENRCHEYGLKDIDLYDALKNEIQESQKTSGGLYYTSSRLNYDKNFFFPKWEGLFYEYQAMRVRANYYSEQLINVGLEIEKNVNMFFDNPSAKASYNYDEVLTFSDANTVVKYYDNDVLEYTNYKRPQKKETTLLSDYATALSFMQNDTMLVNSRYLSGYAEDGALRHFYFDYAYNDFPVRVNYDAIFEGWDEAGAAPMSHAIEISLENGVVYKYKKLCYTFEADPSADYRVSVDIVDHINLMEMPPEEIQDVNVGYYVNRKYNKVLSLDFAPDSEINRARLYYFITPVMGETYILSSGSR